MARISLTGGAYSARSLIAAAQRCVNLYVEAMPDKQGENVKATHYPMPGLTNLAQASGAVRGVWFANSGDLFAVIGTTLYAVSSAWVLTALGTIPGTNPVSMSDNGTTLVVVNGPSGWTMPLGSVTLTQITDPAFYGADRVDYLDTYFVFNKPGTPIFYLSDSEAVTFDPLWFASKSGAADNLQTVIVARRELWLIGAVSTEVWFNAGAADFPYQVVPGAFIEQGTCAKYSPCRLGSAVYWLSQNRAGERYILKGENYAAQAVSTKAIEAAIASYATVSDAIGFTYQQGGHAFYCLAFPSQNITWALDITSGEFTEWAWTNADGGFDRHRANCMTNAYDGIVVGDWENGALYRLDPEVYTDDGNPIVHLRAFPHMVEDADRVMYRQFIADMEVGRTTDSGTPQVSLRWSDTRGATWGNPILLSAGNTGDYYLSMQAQRLGMARDRVFEISWSAPIKTALNGAFIEASKAGS